MTRNSIHRAHSIQASSRVPPVGGLTTGPSMLLQSAREITARSRQPGKRRPRTEAPNGHTSGKKATRELADSRIALYESRASGEAAGQPVGERTAVQIRYESVDRRSTSPSFRSSSGLGKRACDWAASPGRNPK